MSRNKILIPLIIVLLLPFYSMSQSLNDYSAPTSQHTLVESTPINIILANEYKASSDSPRILSGTTSNIWIQEIPVPFMPIAASWKAQEFEAGFDIKSVAEYSISGAQCLIAQGDNTFKDDDSVRSLYVMVLEDPSKKKTWIVHGDYPHNDASELEKLKSAIHSIVLIQ